VQLNSLKISTVGIKQIATYSYGIITFIPVLQEVILQSSKETCAA
jgi:hypothetical protein